MIESLSFDAWAAAMRELKAIRLRARMTENASLEDVFTRALYALGVTRIPMVAALDLQYTAGLIRYSSLQHSVLTLAGNLRPYTSVEPAGPVVAQFPDFTPRSHMS